MSATCPSGGGAPEICCQLIDLDLHLAEARPHSLPQNFPKSPCLMVSQLLQWFQCYAEHSAKSSADVKSRLECTRAGFHARIYPLSWTRNLGHKCWISNARNRDFTLQAGIGKVHGSWKRQEM